MKAFLLATVAAAIAAPALAQTMDGTPAPVEKYAYECVIDKVTPPDRDDKDPSYKINVVVDMTHIDQVWHTFRSGKTADRAAQYQATSGPVRKGEDWTTSPLMWFGPHKKNPQLKMGGSIGTANGPGSKMTYIELLYRGNEKKPVARIDSTCHQIPLNQLS
jgi:hypothetical protein